MIRIPVTWRELPRVKLAITPPYWTNRTLQIYRFTLPMELKNLALSRKKGFRRTLISLTLNSTVVKSIKSSTGRISAITRSKKVLSTKSRSGMSSSLRSTTTSKWKTGRAYLTLSSRRAIKLPWTSLPKTSDGSALWLRTKFWSGSKSSTVTRKKQKSWVPSLFWDSWPKISTTSVRKANLFHRLLSPQRHSKSNAEINLTNSSFLSFVFKLLYSDVMRSPE